MYIVTNSFLTSAREITLKILISLNDIHLKFGTSKLWTSLQCSHKHDVALLFLSPAKCSFPLLYAFRDVLTYVPTPTESHYISAFLTLNLISNAGSATIPFSSSGTNETILQSTLKSLMWDQVEGDFPKCFDPYFIRVNKLCSHGAILAIANMLSVILLLICLPMVKLCLNTVIQGSSMENNISLNYSLNISLKILLLAFLINKINHVCWWVISI